MLLRSLATKFAICCASFLLFVFSFEVNERFDSFALYAAGISLVFIPAGFKLLCLMVGGGAAALGLFLAAIYLSMRVWDHTGLMQMVYFAVAAVGTYYAAVLVIKKLLRINDTLSNLRYLHIIVLSAAASILNGTVHNVVYVWQDKVKLDHFFANAAAMVMGDFLGCFIVIMFFHVCIELAFKVIDGKRRNEHSGVGRVAQLFTQTNT
jgi:integral membrane sensor domain MASE1